MRFTGKRTDRIRMPKQLSFPGDLARYIRAKAEIHDRGIEAQILHYVKQGIRAEESSNADLLTSAHISSHEVTR